MLVVVLKSDYSVSVSIFQIRYMGTELDNLELNSNPQLKTLMVSCNYKVKLFTIEQLVVQ